MDETDEWEADPTEFLLCELEQELDLNIIDGFKTEKNLIEEI